MECQRRGARLDEPRADVEARARPVLEPAPHLDRHGDGDGVRDGGHDPARALGIVQQRRACARLRHLLDGATEVDVHQVGAGRLDHPRRLGHRLRLGAEDLDGEGMLVGGDAQVAERSLVPVVQSGAADHLRADEPGAVTASLTAKGLHAHAGHRSEHQASRDLNRPNPPRRAKIYLHRA